MLSDTKHKRTNIIWLKVYKISRDGQFIETENRLKVTSGREWGMGVIACGYRTFFGKFWKLFQIDSGDGGMNCECTFFLLYTFHLYSAFCQLYLNKTGIKKKNKTGHQAENPDVIWRLPPTSSGCPGRLGLQEAADAAGLAWRLVCGQALPSHSPWAPPLCGMRVPGGSSGWPGPSKHLLLCSSVSASQRGWRRGSDAGFWIWGEIRAKLWESMKETGSEVEVFTTEGSGRPEKRNIAKYAPMHRL